MNFEPIRQAFQSLLGLERRETVSRFLYTIVISVIVVDSIQILERLWKSKGSITPALWVLIAFLLLQFVLLFLLRRGRLDEAALAQIAVSWLLVTYEAWSADGIRDVTIYIYFLIILIAALLTNWRVSTVVAMMSITAIWIFAIAEARGLRSSHIDSPLTMAGDLTAIFILLILLVYLVSNNVTQSMTAMRIGEEKFRKVFHGSPVAISITSLRDGRLLDANDAYLKLIRFDRESAVGRTTYDFGFWSHPSEREKFVKRIKREKSLRNPAYRFRNHLGEERITLSFYELIDVGNEPAVLAMFHDITDQKKAEQALQASEEKYRNFVEQSFVGIWYLAFDQPVSIHATSEEQAELILASSRVAECNDALAYMYGYSSRSELLGQYWFEDLGEERRNKFRQVLMRFVESGYHFSNLETRETTIDGKPVYLLSNGVGVVEGDHLTGIWGTQLDITVLKSTEEALRRSEARTRALLNSIPDMIFELQRDGKILQFIPSTTNEPLYPPEYFMDKKIGDVLPALADQTQFAIERALESGHIHAFQYELFQDGKNRNFEARITPLGQDTVLAMVRDISLQKWIEEEREKLIAELEGKNAELERFTYTVSHDLKSPLITIRGFLGFVREDSQNGNLVRLDADIKRISDATEKMQKLLNDLLELSRVGRLINEPKVIRFNELILDVLELIEGRISQGNVAVSVEENLPSVFGDYQRLLEVMQNLIDNAAKFMGDQPSPRIEIGQRGSRNGMNVFYVRDNGIGIPPEFQENIFGLFNKLDARSEGTGVGLALVRRIIEFHHGTIWVESEPGKGSTFLFTLPSPQDKG